MSYWGKGQVLFGVFFRQSGTSPPEQIFSLPKKLAELGGTPPSPLPLYGKSATLTLEICHPQG